MQRNLKWGDTFSQHWTGINNIQLKVSPDARKKPPPVLYKQWLAKGAAQMIKKPASSAAATPISMKMLQKPLYTKKKNTLYCKMDPQNDHKNQIQYTDTYWWQIHRPWRCVCVGIPGMGRGRRAYTLWGEADLLRRKSQNRNEMNEYILAISFLSRLFSLGLWEGLRLL